MGPSQFLDEILAKLPEIQERLSRMEQRESGRLIQSLKSICAQWTIDARYLPSKSPCAIMGRSARRPEVPGPG